MRTFSPASVASKPSIRTSSSSSSTSLSLRGPLGRALVESWSCGRGPVVGLGLMVRREDAEPARRMPGREGGMTGRVGRGFGLGSCRGAGVAATGGFLAFGSLAAGFLPGALWAADAARARDLSGRARAGFFDGRLEELTPEL